MQIHSREGYVCMWGKGAGGDIGRGAIISRGNNSVITILNYFVQSCPPGWAKAR